MIDPWRYEIVFTKAYAIIGKSLAIDYIKDYTFTQKDLKYHQGYQENSLLPPRKFPLIKLRPRWIYLPSLRKFPPRTFRSGIFPPMFLNIPTWDFWIFCFFIIITVSLILLKRLFQKSWSQNCVMFLSKGVASGGALWKKLFRTYSILQ